MAKRRRLDPTAFLTGEQGADVLRLEDGPGIASERENLSRAKGPGRSMGPPIAQAAGEAAATAALGEVTTVLRTAREEGRLVLRLPLDAVEAGHLARDRLIAEADLSRAKGLAEDRDALEAGDPGTDPDLSRAKGQGGEAMADLKASLRARGQQAPIEVLELPPRDDGTPRWGLISGWRRLAALRALQAEEGGEDRFATVLALVRRPATAAEAYVAMVEENEVRENLSFWERARIVRRAVEAGAFPDEGEALRGLFASASYSRRSKIRSFLPVVAALEGVLAHPEAIGERLGLALARALAEDPGFGPWVRQVITKGPLESAAAEVDLLADLVAAREDEKAERASVGPGSPSAHPEGATGPIHPVAEPEPFARGRFSAPKGEATGAVRMVGEGLQLRVTRGRIEITGPEATRDLAERIEAWLRTTR